MFGLKRLALFGTLLLLLPALAGAQAMVEYGAGVARGGVTGAAAGSGVGKSTGTVFNKAGQTMKYAAKSAGGNAKYPIATPSDPKLAARPAAPVPQPEVANNPVLDPAEVKEGLERQELLDKFGKPSMKITMMDGSDVVERLLYRAPSRDTVLVIVRNGKVASAQALAN
jgi:hypothetical protein